MRGRGRNRSSRCFGNAWNRLRGRVAWPANGFLRELADAAERPDQLGRLDREEDCLGVGRSCELSHRFDIFLRDEIVDRLRAALFDRVADRLGRIRFRLGRALAGLGFTERSLARALGGEDRRLLLAFGLENRRLAQALGLEDYGPLLP